ncbi:hypothetical protein GKC56_02825 [Neisseriaceae bacterium PsAf]|nr:hypothetical protein [Neisseriaceae bacterium PsAf]
MSDDWQNQLKELSKIAKKSQEKSRQQEVKEKQKAKESEIDFARAIGEVKPVKIGNKHVSAKEKPKPYPTHVGISNDEEKQHYIVNVQEDFIQEEPPTQYTRGGQGKNDIKKLLTGQVRIISTLDLHGYSQDEAQEVLNEFIEYVQKRGVAGKIIHGSGLNARRFVSKLKTLVRSWLIEHPEVLAYTEPNNNDGMVLILVKRRRNNQEDFEDKYL